MALLIFGTVCSVAGLVLVLGAGRFRSRGGIARLRDEDDQPEFVGSWSIALGGFLIIIGSAVVTYELINRFG